MVKRKKKLRSGIGIGLLLVVLSGIGFIGSRYVSEKVYASSMNVEQNATDETEEDDEKNNINENTTEESEVKENEKIVYSSLDEDVNAMDASEVQKMLVSWNYLREDNQKIAYLTFDDGPSTTVTPEILEVLKKNNIKATFFVLGSVVEKCDGAKEVLKQMVKDGHAIGNHGYSHDYSILYPNGVVDGNVFINDMKKSEEVLKSVLGEEFHTRVIRFPGGHGSWDTRGVNPLLEQEGYAFIDWNTLNGDAETNENKSSEQLFQRAKATVNDLHGNNDVIVMLMHDKYGKETTAEALQAIIDYLKAEGYQFKTLK